MRPVFAVFQRVQYLTLVVLWLVVNAHLWFWWVRGENWGNPWLFVIMTVSLFYNVTLLPSVFLFFLGKMREPNKESISKSMGHVNKVAMITLTVPGSESLDIVERQLRALKNVTFPHESWILVDKEHSELIEWLAKKHGVNYFCRHDVKKWGNNKVSRWNQIGPPFQEKTKAGNVNAWIDEYGDKYSHFTQLDIDHNPIQAYLDEVLPYFGNSKIAWVQAPSVYNNFAYWTARGSAEQELVLQGPLQMGFFGFCKTPFIIGSHCTYDMQAIKRIGGFQPTRAEDHLDTVCLAANGKEGVYLPKIIATGDGPENFEMYLKQQFAWAYSMIQVLFSYTPRMIKNYTFKQSIQFLFVQTWYPFSSLSMLALFLLPVFCLLFNVNISNVSYWEFAIHALPVSLVGFGIWKWSKKWHLPKGVNLSWRGVVLYAARWIVVLQAFVQVVFRVKKPYMITAKGLKKSDVHPFSIWPLVPYLILASISLSACWIYLDVYKAGATQGYLLFAIQAAAYLLLICVVALAIDLGQMLNEGVSIFKVLALRRLPLFLIFLGWFWWSDTFAVSAGKIYQAVFLVNPVPGEFNQNSLKLDPCISSQNIEANSFSLTYEHKVVENDRYSDCKLSI